MTLEFEIANDLNKLHDELLAAVPKLRGLTGDGGDPRLRVEGTPKKVTVTFDGRLGVTEEQVRAVVMAHDPTPVTTTTPDDRLIDAIARASTLEELKAALTGASGEVAVRGRWLKA